ncbi:MAG: holo-ACP synthase [Acidimicrobiales bacterium]
MIDGPGGPVAVGIDVVDVARIRTALDRTPSLADRTFTEAELAYCRAARDPAERFAARWAAKEAVVKCLGGGVPGIDLRCIEVVRGDDGAPHLRLSGEAAARADQRGIASWLVSLSHTSTVAQAIALALGPGRSD